MIGTQVSHYRLVRKLGAGTFGEVYEGVHVHDEELRVAVKIVAPSLVQDARFVEALKRECRQLDKMRHPNIVTFRDLVVQGDQVAMLLELLRGQDLHDRLAGGALAVDTAVSVLEAMLDGLAYAHASGVLHRDIKPGNVYWCDDGRIVILDFGIARAADGTQATKTGHMVGTFDYMAPERFDGQHGSASSDVYAMGLIAWELLTGRVACPEGEPGRKMKWHLMHGLGNAAVVQAAVPGCPPWLAEVVATLAATEVAKRPADGAAALALLREKRSGAGPIPAAAPSDRRPPPSTVMGPAPVGSVPPVAASVPPVSVPPSTMRRSAPPGTVMGPTSSAPPSAPPVAASVPFAPNAPAILSAPSEPPASMPASGGSKVPLLVGGLVVLAGGAWFALRGPSVASIELEPKGDVSLVVGSDTTAPTARALDAQGNVVAGVEVSCTSDTPSVRLRDGKLSATEAAQATVTCAAGGAEARFMVRVASSVDVATIDISPSGEVLLEVGVEETAPTARAFGRDGEQLFDVEPKCASDKPSVSLRDGKIVAAAPVRATITCIAQETQAQYTVEAVTSDSLRSAKRIHNQPVVNSSSVKTEIAQDAWAIEQRELAGKEFLDARRLKAGVERDKGLEQARDRLISINTRFPDNRHAADIARNIDLVDDSLRNSRASEAAPTVGTLRVRSEPSGAKVFIDNTERGRTPLDVELPYGSHNVRVAQKGYKPETQDVSIRVYELTVPFTLRSEPTPAGEEQTR